MMKRKRSLTFLIGLIISVYTYSQQIYDLNSYPDARSTVFLDFDGQTVSGTAWNTTGPIYCGSSGLSEAVVSDVFNRVSEDFSGFEVNITTDSNKYFSAPVYSRVRVIVTITSDWYGTAGGVALAGSFSWGDDTPCFVFSQLLGYNVKKVAEACSHEIGHTLGLFHQSLYSSTCVKQSDYNPGHGTGEIGWAPIMGTGYYQNLTQWHQGPNSFGCANIQSDLQIITGGANGFGYRIDDYGDNTGLAELISFTANHFSINGILEKPADNDLFKFNMVSAAGLNISANPFSAVPGSVNTGGGADLELSLLDNNGVELTKINQASILSASVDTFLNAGVYYLKIRGVGNEYSPGYASIGKYNISGYIYGALPVYSVKLFVARSGNGGELEWEIQADEEIDSILLEQLPNGGSNFKMVSQLRDEKGKIDITGFAAKGEIYRLRIVLKTGHSVFSAYCRVKPGGYQNSIRMMFISPVILEIVSEQKGSLILQDVGGRVLRREGLRKGVNRLDMTGLPKGIYFVSGVYPGGVLRQKLILF